MIGFIVGIVYYILKKGAKSSKNEDSNNIFTAFLILKPFLGSSIEYYRFQYQYYFTVNLKRSELEVFCLVSLVIILQ